MKNNFTIWEWDARSAMLIHNGNLVAPSIEKAKLLCKQHGFLKEVTIRPEIPPYLEILYENSMNGPDIFFIK